MTIEEIKRLLGSPHLQGPGKHHLADLRELCDDIQAVGVKARRMMEKHEGDSLAMRRHIVGLHQLATAKHILLDALGLTKIDRGGYGEHGINADQSDPTETEGGPEAD